MDSDDDLSLASSADLEADDDSSVGDFGQGKPCSALHPSMLPTAV